jgi:hypothetical protein
VSSSQLTETRDRVRSFGGYNKSAEHAKIITEPKALCLAALGAGLTTARFGLSSCSRSAAADLQRVFGNMRPNWSRSRRT